MKDQFSPILLTKKTKIFYFFRADTDELVNRWMVVKSSPSLLHQFFTKEINTLALIEQNPDGFVYFIDTDNKGTWNKLQLVANSNIPNTYFPSDNSFYLADHYEDYAQELAAYLSHYFARRDKRYLTVEANLAAVNEPVIPFKKKR